MKRLSGKRHEMPVRRFRGTMQSREGTNGPRCLKTLWSGGKAEPPGVAFLQKKAERVQFKDDNHGMSIPAEYTHNLNAPLREAFRHYTAVTDTRMLRKNEKPQPRKGGGERVKTFPAVQASATVMICGIPPLSGGKWELSPNREFPERATVTRRCISQTTIWP